MSFWVVLVSSKSTGGVLNLDPCYAEDRSLYFPDFLFSHLELIDGSVPKT